MTQKEKFAATNDGGKLESIIIRSDKEPGDDQYWNDWSCSARKEEIIGSRGFANVIKGKVEDEANKFTIS